MDKYGEYDMNEAITNYINYLENKENSNSLYNREKIKNGYKALENKDLQLEYLVDGFNSMLDILETTNMFASHYRVRIEALEELNEDITAENSTLRKSKGYNTDFYMEIKDYLNVIKIAGDGSVWESKRLDRCRKALDDITLQDMAIKEIIKDLVCKIRILKSEGIVC